MKNNKIILFVYLALSCGITSALNMVPGEINPNSRENKILERNLNNETPNNINSLTPEITSKVNPSRLGKIVIFDQRNNIAIIGKNNYSFSTTFKYYDGNPSKGDVVKFNINDKNEIIDMWVIKK